MEKRDELTIQQKLWKGTEVLLNAMKPLVLYMCFPGLLMCAGMLIFGGRNAQEVISGSGNFYYSLGILLTIVVLHRKSKKKGSSVWEESALEWKELDRRRLLLLVGMGIGYAVFFSSLLTVLPFPQSWKETYQQNSGELFSGTDQILTMLSAIFLAPVAEEIIFRGYMLGRLLKWFTIRQGIILSAAIFALCHLSLLWMIYAFLMGILLGWVSVKEDNTMYSIALHIGFNASVLPIRLINGTQGLKNLLFGSPFCIALWGAAALGLAIWSLNHYKREEYHD